jgi:hypothetical protein
VVEAGRPRAPLAVVIDNTRRDYPRRQLVFLTPTAKFPVRQQGDRMVLDPDGYHRFDIRRYRDQRRSTARGPPCAPCRRC